ncbi:Cucumisin [Bertholletia excelsa]
MQLKQSVHVLDYIKSTRNPTGVIMKSIEGKEPLAPIIAGTSSRGPSPISPSILKPDITAPGVDILAAYSPLASVSRLPGDTRRVPFNIISGTSMSCPHVSGVAAYVKSIHPDWSPAAIQSAIITSAHPMSSKTNPDGEFAYGAGFLNPLGAAHPGLVYDRNETNYIDFLCAEGYNAQQLKILTKDESRCSKSSIKSDGDLNYPSFTVSTLRLKQFRQIFERTVTNVGSPQSTYKATFYAPKSTKIQFLIEPDTLKFKSTGEKLTFKMLVFGVLGQFDEALVSASLVWDDGRHRVRSPIVVHVPF